ncbi:MAG: hypothetical protein ACRYF3_01240 [Janthinobacterium lividum]
MDNLVNVIDLRGQAPGDPAGLATVAAALREVCVTLARSGLHPLARLALSDAADAADEAAVALRELPRPVALDAVESCERRLAGALRRATADLAGSPARSQVV